MVVNDTDPYVDGMASLKKVFSSEFYLSAYPDVANAGVDPWDHFSKHGLFEGRTPNPYIDPAYMADLLGVPVGDVLLEAFRKKIYWATNTSSYVDIENFVINGPWDGATHPLEQLILGGLHVEPWVKYAGSFSDIASIDGHNQRLMAISILEHLNGPKFHFTRPLDFLLSNKRDGEIVFESEEKIYCIPGFMLCANGEAHPLSTSSQLISQDSSAIKHGEKVTLFEHGESFQGKSLVIAPGDLRRKEAMRWINQLEPSSIVVPVSADQEFLLRHCIKVTNIAGVTILVYGVQSVVVCKEVLIHNQISKKPRRLFRSPEKMRRKSLLIIAESYENLLANQAKVSVLTKRGARVCVSSNQTAALLLGQLVRARVVILCGHVTWPELWIDRSIPIIGLGEWT